MQSAQETHSAAYGWRHGRALALGLVLLAVLIGCSRPADEQALRDTLAAMHDAAEQRNAADLIEHVADNFAGPRGLDRDGLRRLLVVQFMRNRAVSVTPGPVSTRIEGQRAEAEFTAALAGFQEGLLPARADGYRIVTGWRIEDGRWMLERASWE